MGLKIYRDRVSKRESEKEVSKSNLCGGIKLLPIEWRFVIWLQIIHLMVQICNFPVDSNQHPLTAFMFALLSSYSHLILLTGATILIIIKKNVRNLTKRLHFNCSLSLFFILKKNHTKTHT